MRLITDIAGSLGAVAEPRADATVDAILDAALEEFTLIGLQRATVGSVAKRARVAPATIYRRIGQRDELVRITLAREVRRCLAEIADAIAPYESLEDRIVETFIAMKRTMFENPLLQRMAQIEPDALAVLLTFDAGPLLALGEIFIRTELGRTNRRGDTDIPNPAGLATVLVRVMHSLLLTPDPAITGDETRARQFARETIVPLVASQSNT